MLAISKINSQEAKRLSLALVGLGSGTDLGPLMGLPNGVKDIMVMDGLPMQTSGLPTGLQFTMPLNHDARLLATGREIERVLKSR